MSLVALYVVVAWLRSSRFICTLPMINIFRFVTIIYYIIWNIKKWRYVFLLAKLCSDSSKKLKRKFQEKNNRRETRVPSTQTLIMSSHSFHYTRYWKQNGNGNLMRWIFGQRILKAFEYPLCSHLAVWHQKIVIYSKDNIV